MTYLSSSLSSVQINKGVVCDPNSDCLFFTQGDKIRKYNPSSQIVTNLFDAKNDLYYDFFGIDFSTDGKKLLLTNSKRGTIEELDLKSLKLKILFKPSEDGIGNEIYSSFPGDIKVVGTDSAYISYPYDKKVVLIKDIYSSTSPSLEVLKETFEAPFGIAKIENFLYIADKSTVKIYDIIKYKITSVCEGFKGVTGIVAYHDENDDVTRVYVFDQEDRNIFVFTHDPVSKKSSNLSKVTKLGFVDSTTFLIALKINKEVVTKIVKKGNLPTGKSAPSFTRHNLEIFVPSGEVGGKIDIFDRNGLVPVRDYNLNEKEIVEEVPKPSLTPPPPQLPLPKTNKKDKPEGHFVTETVNLEPPENNHHNECAEDVILTDKTTSSYLKSVAFWISIFFIILISMMIIYYYVL